MRGKKNSEVKILRQNSNNRYSRSKCEVPMCQVALFSIARMSGDSRLVNFCNRDGGLSYINPTL